jgi:hypothetical protein
MEFIDVLTNLELLGRSLFGGNGWLTSWLITWQEQATAWAGIPKPNVESLDLR